MNPPGVGPQQVHGLPGTPVGDLLPLGNALMGDGNRSSLRPIRAGELRSHMSCRLRRREPRTARKWKPLGAN